MAIHDTLNAIVERLDRIEQVLLARQPAADERHAERLTVLADATKGREFTSVELVAHAVTQPALRAMLAEVPITTPKECGRFLRRLERRSGESHPLRLVRIGQCRDGLVWAVHVSRVISPHNSRV